MLSSKKQWGSSVEKSNVAGSTPYSPMLPVTEGLQASEQYHAVGGDAGVNIPVSLRWRSMGSSQRAKA